MDTWMKSTYFSNFTFFYIKNLEYSSFQGNRRILPITSKKPCEFGLVGQIGCIHKKESQEQEEFETHDWGQK